MFSFFNVPVTTVLYTYCPPLSLPDALPSSNLFRLNRYEFVERVTSGSRIDYALRTGIYGDGGGSTELLVGQSSRFYGDSAFEDGTGLSEALSDVVGAITVRPRDEFDLDRKRVV